MTETPFALACVLNATVSVLTGSVLIILVFWFTLRWPGPPTRAALVGNWMVVAHEASRRAAERIPGARFASVESGGHLMLGQQKKGRDELAHFFCRERGSPRGAGGILRTPKIPQSRGTSGG